jgi:hypothetical protein
VDSGFVPAGDNILAVLVTYGHLLVDGDLHLITPQTDLWRMSVQPFKVFDPYAASKLYFDVMNGAKNID